MATDELEGTVSSLPVPLGPACLCILRFPITIILNRPRRALGPVPVAMIWCEKACIAGHAAHSLHGHRDRTLE